MSYQLPDDCKACGLSHVSLPCPGPCPDGERHHWLNYDDGVPDENGACPWETMCSKCYALAPIDDPGNWENGKVKWLSAASGQTKPPNQTARP